jgi:hypothetical protein
MSSQKSVVPLRINLRGSRILAGFIMLSHGGAIVLSLASLPLWIGTLFSAGIVYSLVYLLKRHGLLRGPNAITILVWDSNDEWLIITEDGKEYHATLQKPVYLHARIVILNFIVNNRHRPIILLPDVLDRESFRRLRVRLQLEQYKASR